MCFVGLELPVKFPRFCKSVHRERYLFHFIDERQCFLSTFLYKLKKTLYEQPQIGFFFKEIVLSMKMHITDVYVQYLK